MPACPPILCKSVRAATSSPTFEAMLSKCTPALGWYNVTRKLQAASNVGQALAFASTAGASNSRMPDGGEEWQQDPDQCSNNYGCSQSAAARMLTSQAGDAHHFSVVHSNVPSICRCRASRGAVRRHYLFAMLPSAGYLSLLPRDTIHAQDLLASQLLLHKALYSW